MPVPIPQVNANQTQQSNLVGQLDLQAGRYAGVVSGRISPNATGPVAAGSSVKLDTANTGFLPWFLPCAGNDVAFGRLVFVEKSSDPAPGEPCEVAFNGGPIIWCVADLAILPQQVVEDGTDGPNFVNPAGTTGGYKQRGVALDGGAQGALVRIITNPSLT